MATLTDDFPRFVGDLSKNTCVDPKPLNALTLTLDSIRSNMIFAISFLDSFPINQ